jgi:hypothetical protein
MESLEAAEDLACSPTGSLPAELEGSFEDVGRCGVRGRMGPVGAVFEAIRPVDLVALEPLVAGLAADVVTPAELGVREQTSLGLDDELLAFGHRIGLQPWHRRAPIREEFAPG